MANRYFVGTTTGTWSTTGNWATVSNGTGGATVPTVADDTFFDSFSPTCSITAAATCKSMNHTGYTRQFLWSNNLTIAGGFTLSSAATYTQSGSRTTIISASGSLRFNGKTLPTIFSCTTINTVLTLTDDWVLANNVIISGELATPITLKSSTASVQRKFTIPNVSYITQDFDFVYATDIDTGDGQTAWTYKGTYSNCINWLVMPVQPGTVVGTWTTN